MLPLDTHRSSSTLVSTLVFLQRFSVSPTLVDAFLTDQATTLTLTQDARSGSPGEAGGQATT